MTYDLDENGNVKETFGDMMRALGNKSYKPGVVKIKEPKEPKESFVPKKGVLFVDILEEGCYDCPCCDNEQCYCTVLEGGPSCEYRERLENCPIKEITITPEEFAKRMRKINETYPDFHDTDERHIAMDDLMCEVLRELGYVEGIDIFNCTEKWYE